jgi:hypothetical protein
MEVGGYEIPESFQGRSVFHGSLAASPNAEDAIRGEEIIRQRLSGLGYIS